MIVINDIENIKSNYKTNILDSKEDIEAMILMNKQMEKVHRDFIIKNFNSEQSAKDVILNN
jgi:hypothetical protein